MSTSSSRTAAAFCCCAAPSRRPRCARDRRQPDRRAAEHRLGAMEGRCAGRRRASARCAARGRPALHVPADGRDGSRPFAGFVNAPFFARLDRRSSRRGCPAERPAAHRSRAPVRGRVARGASPAKSSSSRSNCVDLVTWSACRAAAPDRSARGARRQARGAPAAAGAR